MSRVAPIFALLASCSSAPETRKLKLPPDVAGTESILAALVVSGEIAKAVAVEASEVLSFDLNPDGDNRLELLVFDLPVDVLATTPGLLVRKSEIQGGQPPPEGGRAFSALPEQDGETFRAVDRSELALSHFLYDRAVDNSCAPFLSPQIFSTQLLARRPRAVELDDSSALLLSDWNILYFDSRSSEPPVLVSDAPCVRDGIRTSNGALFLVDCANRILEAEFDPVSLELRTTFVTLFPVGAEEILWLAGGEGTAGMELAGMTESGQVAVYDGVKWATYRDLRRREPNSTALGGIGWVGPGDFVAGVASQAEPLRIRDGVATLIPTDSTSGVAGVAVTQTLGPVMGDDQASFWVQSGNRFATLGFPRFGAWAKGMTPYRNGFVFGTPFGGLGRYTPTGGMCDLERVLAFEIEDIVVLGGGDILLIIGTPTSAQEVVVAVVRTR